MKILKVGSKVQPSKLLIENARKYSGMTGVISELRPSGMVRVRWHKGPWGLHIRQELDLCR